MLTSDIRQLAKDFDMVAYEKDFVYKNINGYVVSAFSTEKERRLLINAVITDSEYEDIREELAAAIKEFDTNNKIISYSYKQNEFEFIFGFKADIYYYMGNFMQAFTKKLAEKKIKGVDYCSVCGEPLTKDDRYIMDYNSSAKCVHLECEKKLIEENKEKAQDRNLITPSVGKGVFAIIACAITSSFVWGMLEGFNLFPFIAGGVIGYLMKKFYDISAGKPGFAKISLVTLGNALGIFLGYVEGFTTRYVLGVRKGIFEKASFGQILSKVPASIAEHKLSLLIGFLFSIIICYDVFIYGGNKSTYVEEFKPIAKNIRKY